MNSIAAGIAVNNLTDLAASALPNAPVEPDPEPRGSALRITVATLLRTSARRRSRLADRLDPCTRRPRPVPAA